MKDSLKRLMNVLGMGAAVRDGLSRGRYLFDAETRRRNARFKDATAPDGLPMPPPELIYLVTGQYDAEAFYDNGVVGANCIREVLRKHGLSIDAFKAILDFGCGCGRVMRQWQNLQSAKLHGVDYNPRLIEWCRKHLSFATFDINRANTPLGFPGGTFDFIYSISVFTHLTEPAQRFWMDELVRVLKPSGYLHFTVHGSSRLGQLTQEQRADFDAGKPVIVGSQYSGTNFCGTYHPEQHVRNVLCKNLRFVAFEPGGAKDANQDVFLMQKPESA